METRKYVDRFRETIISYGIPYEKIVISPYSNGIHSGVVLFNGINVADYVSCHDQSANDVSRQVAKELHVKYKRGIGF